MRRCRPPSAYCTMKVREPPALSRRPKPGTSSSKKIASLLPGGSASGSMLESAGPRFESWCAHQSAQALSRLTAVSFRHAISCSFRQQAASARPRGGRGIAEFLNLGFLAVTCRLLFMRWGMMMSRPHLSGIDAGVGRPLRCRVSPGAQRKRGRTPKSEGAMTVLLTRLFALAYLLASPAALGQTYPDRNVTIVVTSAAGALTDVLTRAVAQRLSETWKQSVIVENRGGAGYSIAAQSVMRSEHDGYTLLASETGFYTTQPHLYAKDKLPYDAEKDFVPVAGYGTIPTALLVNPSVPVNSVSDLIALAKT